MIPAAKSRPAELTARPFWIEPGLADDRGDGSCA
jgi:hypothetical protein